MKQASFKIQKRVRGKSVDYKIYVPAYLSPTGKPESRFFPTKAEALIARGELLAACRTESKVQGLSNAQATDALRALQRLAEAGIDMTLDKVVELALPTLRAAGSHISIDAVLAEFAEVKEAEWRPKTRQNFRFISAAFLREFSGRSIASISGKDISLWLARNYKNPTTKTSALRTLSPAFTYASQQEMIAESPIQRVSKPRVKQREAIDIFSPEEAQRLMKTAPEDCKAAYALLLFSGIRPTELTRLKWSDIKDGFIHITPRIAKTQQVRNIEVEPNLDTWLAQRRGEPNASVCPPNWKRKNTATRRDAGLSGRADAARHSYATYYLAKYKDVNALKMNLGHSNNSNVLFAHYRAAATPTTAAQYWSITPETQALQTAESPSP